MKHLIRFGANIQNSIITIITFTAMNLYGAVKIFLTEIIICGIRNTLYRPPKSLGVVAYRVTSKIIGIGFAERSWGNFKTIKSGKISAPGSDMSEK